MNHILLAKYFTSLDLKSGYWQIPLDDKLKSNTAFPTEYGQYQWDLMSFSLTNAPAAFQRRTNHIFAPFMDIFLAVYLDDILIFGKSHSEHEEHVKQVLKVLNDATMVLNLDQCKFLEREVKFIRQI
jgi:hypothetical protein